MYVTHFYFIIQRIIKILIEFEIIVFYYKITIIRDS